ncbi:MAG: tetratricopeptide repeat protein, partial [Rhizomicrobium sp.]
MTGAPADPHSPTQQAAALHDAGRLALRQGQCAQAAALLAQACHLMPTADRFSDLAVALQRSGDLSGALECITAARALGDTAEISYNRASLLLMLKRPVEALTDFDRVLILRPDYVEAHVNRAATLAALGRRDDAIAAYRHALALLPEDRATMANIAYHLGYLLQQCDRLTEALAAYDQALSCHPAHSAAANNRGVVLQGLGRNSEALTAFRQAVAVDSGNADALVNLGAALLADHQPDAALAALDAAIIRDDTIAEAHQHRGTVLKTLGRMGQAEVAYQKAVALKPDFAEAHANLGLMAMARDAYAAAIGHLETAMICNPVSAEYHCNYALSQQALKNPAEARAAFLRAIALAPSNASMQWNLALLELAEGNFKTGWELYEWRWRREVFAKEKHDFAVPRWLGKEDICGKHILVHAEQGFGDTVQFCRYLPLLAARGAKVIFEAPRPLLPLMKSLVGDITLVARGDALPEFDYYTALMSLPRAFGTEVASIPATIPYLSAAPEVLERWNTRLGPKTRPRIGLVVSGKPEHANDRNRSIALSQFAALLDLPCDFHLIQKELRDDDADCLKSRPQLHCHSAALTD